MDVARIAVRGIASLAASKVALMLVSLATTTLIAGFVTKAEFGLIGMTSLVVGLFVALNTLGIDAAIIGTRDLTQLELTTIYWVKMLVALASLALMVLAAFPVAQFFKSAELAPIVGVLGLRFVTGAFFQVHRSLMRKATRFAEMARFTVVSSLLGGVAGVIAAACGFGAWSLVFQGFAEDLVSIVQYRAAEAWRPDWSMDIRGSRRVLKFGANMFGSSLALYLQRNIDYLIVAKLLGKEPFGVYTLAYRIMYQPVRQVSYLFTDVMFPVLAGVNQDLAKVRETYANSLKFTAMVTFPAMTWIGVEATDFVLTFFGQKWLETAALVRIMAVAGAAQSIAQIGYLLFPALNRPQWSFRMGIANCVIFGVAVAVGAWRWGATGVAAGMTIGTLVGWVITQTLANRITGWSWWEALLDAWKILAACLVMGVLGWFLGRWELVGRGLPWIRLAVLSTAMFGIYAVLVWTMEGEDIRRGWRLIRDRAGKKAAKLSQTPGDEA